MTACKTLQSNAHANAKAMWISSAQHILWQSCVFFVVWWWNVAFFFPTCQVRVVRFYHSCSSFLLPFFLPAFLPSSLLPSSPIFVASPIFIANLLRRSCLASSGSQCAPLDLNRKDPLAVCTPGPQPQGSDRSVHPWTSTARIRSQCAPLDLNRKDPIAVCTAGPQPDSLPDKMPDRMPGRLPDRMLQEDMPDSMPNSVSDRLLDTLPDRMPENMPDGMPEDMPDRMTESMPDKMPQDMPDRMPGRCQVGITRSKVILNWLSSKVSESNTVEHLQGVDFIYTKHNIYTPTYQIPWG